MYCKNSSFLVLGMQKSGYGATSLLLLEGAKVYMYDDNQSETVKKNMAELESKGAKICTQPLIQLEYVDVLVLSPSIPIDHEIAVRARELKKRIIGEFELASLFTNNLCVAVTGTNGKTTTCSLLEHVLSKVFSDVMLVGNVGIPFSSKVVSDQKNRVYIAEVSSFQLETINRFTPHVACILNVTPDHLTRHYNMENYLFLKSKLILNLRESEFAVLNYDDVLVSSLSKKTRAKVVWFSLNEKIDGAYKDGDFLYYKDELIISVNEINISGNHNIENVLCAICVLKILGIQNEDIVNGIKDFSGVKHRIQKVKTVNGVTFFNDSKSTNPDSCISAINSMSNKTILIMGGYDKGLDYESVMRQIKKSKTVEKVVLTGQSANSMFKDATRCGLSEVYVVKDFDIAVKVAYNLAGDGYSVLLSPATSSFDIFSSYEERGDKFIEIVNAL